MLREKTVRTTTILRRKSIKTGKILETETLNAVKCCQYINEKSVVNSSNTMEMALTIRFNEMPAKYRSKKFIQKWLDFINSFGLNIKLKKINTSEYSAYMEDAVTKWNYYYLINLNLIRYLWSTHYSHFPDIVFMLRDLPELEHLDNWEIFQLAHHGYDLGHFNDMTPVNTSMTTSKFHITSQKFLTRRLKENFGTNLSTFNIPWRGKPFNYDEVYKLKKDKKYLEIYNLMSTIHNKISEYSHAVCIDDSGFTDVLEKGNKYIIVRELKNLIKIENDNYHKQLYKKKRFKLI